MSEDFLAGLAGLVTGVSEGMDKKRDQKNVEAERAFRLSQFEASTRRNSMLDALNEEVAKSRLALQERSLQLDEERGARDRANSEEIPVNIGDQTFTLPRTVATRLSELQAQISLQQQSQVPLESGGFGSPEFVANQASQSQEARDRRSFQIKEMIADRESSLLQSGIGPGEARRQALTFGKLMFPAELGDLDLEKMFPEPPAGPTSSERPAGLMDRLTALLGGLGAVPQGGGTSLLQSSFGGDPIEAIREAQFGPKGPQTLEELQAAREGRLLQSRGIYNRALTIPPPTDPELQGLLPPSGARVRF